VRLGDYDLSKDVDCINGVCGDPFIQRVISQIFVHPGYDGREHDIAILKMNEPVPCTGK
jgi:serine protease 7